MRPSPLNHYREDLRYTQRLIRLTHKLKTTKAEFMELSICPQAVVITPSAATKFNPSCGEASIIIIL